MGGYFPLEAIFLGDQIGPRLHYDYGLSLVGGDQFVHFPLLSTNKRSEALCFSAHRHNEWATVTFPGTKELRLYLFGSSEPHRVPSHSLLFPHTCLVLYVHIIQQLQNTESRQIKPCDLHQFDIINVYVHWIEAGLAWLQWTSPLL